MTSRAVIAIVVLLPVAALAGESTAGAISIVRTDSPSPAEQLAREELASYLARMKTTKLEVQTADGVVAVSEILAVNSGPAIKDVQPPLPALSLAGGYAIALRGNRLLLVGSDGASLLYAAYDLLERLGCRFLAPAFDFYKQDHEYVPEKPVARIALPKDAPCGPSFRYRKLYVEEGLSHNTENLLQMIAWMPKRRFNTLVVPIDYQGRGRVRWDNWREALIPELKRRGIKIEVGGHGYQNFLNAKMNDGRVFREHPEWFAMDANGRRTQLPGWVLCSSNPQAVEALEQGVLDYLERHPEIEIFDFWPPDGAKWCTCKPCQDLGSPSTRHALLVSQVCQTLKRKMPSVRLECIAYSSYLDPPEKAAIDPSVLVDFCPIGQCFEVQINHPGNPANSKYAAALQAWTKSFSGDISIYSYYRKYAWHSLPTQIPHYMQNDLRYYLSQRVKGISTYAEAGDWFTYELNHYGLSHLAWDPNTDVDGLINDFCSVRYGPEATLARETFDTMEAVVRHACSLPGTSLKSPAEYDGFIARLVAQRKKIVDAQKRHERDDKLGAHLGRLALMLEYAIYDAGIQVHRAAGGRQQDRTALVDVLADFLEQNADKGVFIHRASLGKDRIYKRYGIEAK